MDRAIAVVSCFILVVSPSVLKQVAEEILVGAAVGLGQVSMTEIR
jgi:hypothetical protein